MVAMIAARLAKVMGEDINMTQVMAWALIHDLPEVLTGDIATPVKRMLGPDSAATLKNFEARVSTPLGWCDTASVPEKVLHIVKIADTIEAIAFLQLNAASTHGKDIEAKLTKIVVDAGPEAEVVLREILYSDPITIDSLAAKNEA